MCRVPCANVAGWYRPIPFRRTVRISRRCGSSSSEGFSHDLADLLVDDIKRQLPQLEKQPAPMPEPKSSFHH